MQHVFRWTVIGLLSLTIPSRAHAQATAATAPRDSVKSALLHTLLERTHAADQAIALMESSVAAQRAANPRLPSVFWDRFLAQARLRRGELADMVVVVYDRHFSTDEIRQLLALYETPFGQKLLSVQPAIAQESMQAGRDWGSRIGAEVGAQLDAEGVQVPQ